MSNYIKRFEGFPEILMTWLQEVAGENNCVLEKTVWQHKEDSSIIYETKPANPEMYTFIVTIKSGHMENLKFIDYLVKAKLQTIDFLKSCMTEG